MLTRMGDVLTSEEAASQILKNPWFYGGSFRFRKKESIRGFTYITYRFRLEGLGSMDRWAQGFRRNEVPVVFRACTKLTGNFQFLVLHLTLHMLLGSLGNTTSWLGLG